MNSTKNNKIVRTGLILPIRLLTLLLVLQGCSNDDQHVDMTPEITEGNPTITYYTPTEGGRLTTISLYGTHFGTDLDKIMVKVNGVPAEVVSSTGNLIEAKIKQNAGSGKVEVSIHGEEEAQNFTYDVPFNYTIRMMVKTYLGDTGDEIVNGKDDGSFEEATFTKPRYLTWDNDGGLYIVEDGKSSNDNYSSIRYAKDNNVTTVIKSSQSNLIERIRAIDLSFTQDTLFIANDQNGGGSSGISIMEGTPNGGYDTPTSLWDEGGITAVSVHPITGEVFAGYHSDAAIYRYDGENFESLVRLPGVVEGTFADNGEISSIVFDNSGSAVFVVSRKRNVIYKGNYDMSSHTFSDLHIFAGSYGESGYTDGLGASAKFNEPCQADLDDDGNLYVADRKNHCIRKITPDGAVTTYTGKGGGKSGFVDGPIGDAEFNHPEGLQFGPDGALYVAEYWNHRIRKIYEE